MMTEILILKWTNHCFFLIIIVCNVQKQTEMHEITKKKSVINTVLLMGLNPKRKIRNKQQYVPIWFIGKCIPHCDVRATTYCTHYTTSASQATIWAFISGSESGVFDTNYSHYHLQIICEFWLVVCHKTLMVHFKKKN